MIFLLYGAGLHEVKEEQQSERGASGCLECVCLVPDHAPDPFAMYVHVRSIVILSRTPVSILFVAASVCMF